MINTDQAPLYIMENDHLGRELFFNGDSSEDVTGNVRDRSSAIIDGQRSRFAHLDIDNLRAYNDEDPKLTDSQNLEIPFNAVWGVEYDTVRLHLARGFNFEGGEGLYFEAKVRKFNNDPLRLLGLTYTVRDDFEKMSPSPFLFAGTFYSTYLEAKVPSIRGLIESFERDYLIRGEQEIPAYKLTDGKGFDKNTLIECEFGIFSEFEQVGRHRFFNLGESTPVSLNQQDRFASMSAVVREAEDADYIELFGLYNGESIENLIKKLNNSPRSDYVLIHQIQVSEQVGGQFLITQNQEIAQVEDFGDPIKFRPVIENTASAVAWRLDYTLKLFNRFDNSQTFKEASLISKDVFKYGRTLRRLDISDNPIQLTVYNKKESPVYNIPGKISDLSIIEPSPGSGEGLSEVSFVNFNDVAISSSNLRVREEDGEQVLISEPTSSEGREIKGQGQSVITISPYTVFIKFVIHERRDDDTVSTIDLNNLGPLFLNFSDEQGNPVSIEEYNKADVSKGNGEIVFKIPKEEAEKITGFSNKYFTISANNVSGEVAVYHGKYITHTELSEQNITDVIDQKDERIEELQSRVSQLEDQNQADSSLLEDKNNQIQSLQSRIEALKEELDTAIEEENQRLNEETEKNTAKERRDRLERLQELKTVEVDPPTLPKKPKEVDVEKLNKKVATSKRLK